MKLVSCDNCGVLIDLDKKVFPKDIYNEDDTINTKVADYNYKTKYFEAFIECPLCEEKIFNE